MGGSVNYPVFLGGLKFLGLVIFFLCASGIRGQHYSITSYGTEQGLVQGAIYGISQDDRDLIWIGTDQGLYRFDGVNFKKYDSQDGLSDNEVFEALGDSNDFFFIINFYKFLFFKNLVVEEPTISNGKTSLFTTVPMPIMAPSPILIPGMMETFIPTHTFFPIITGL